MSQSLRVYLDACCLNRPFDDQTQPRIALETQAILTILRQCESGNWKLMSSDALDVELEQTPDRERLGNVRGILAMAKIRVVSSLALETRAKALQELGFSSYDAIHIASAERGRTDVFLSTDDRLVKRAQRHAQEIQIPISNPVQWLMQFTQTEDKNNG
jgi:predicted nucleic acid-binding protein